jgi:hypothetical protein
MISRRIHVQITNDASRITISKSPLRYDKGSHLGCQFEFHQVRKASEDPELPQFLCSQHLLDFWTTWFRVRIGRANLI